MRNLQNDFALSNLTDGDSFYKLIEYKNMFEVAETTNNYG